MVLRRIVPDPDPLAPGQKALAAAAVIVVDEKRTREHRAGIERLGSEQPGRNRDGIDGPLSITPDLAPGQFAAVSLCSANHDGGFSVDQSRIDLRPHG